MLTFPFYSSLDGQPICVTRVGADASVYHHLVEIDGKMVKTGQDIPAPGFTLTPETTEADILAHLLAPPVNNDTTAEWITFLAGSITDTQTGIRLKTNRQARNDFIGQAVLLREALEAGAIDESTPVTVWDVDNVEHELTVVQMRALLLRYGIEWNHAFNQLAP